MHKARVAVFVDGDNVSASFAAHVLGVAGELGRVDVARVYGGQTLSPDWVGAPGFRAMLAGAGKNAADMMLSLDALDLALSGGPDTCVIASSDGDFRHVALRLRERGVAVMGLGVAKTPDAFRAACGMFRTLPSPGVCASVSPDPPATAPTDFNEQIRAMIEDHDKTGKGMRIADLAPRMHRTHGTLISSKPGGTWRAYLAKRPALFEIDPRGADARVRIRAEGFAAR